MNDILESTNGQWQYWAEVNNSGEIVGEYGICIDPDCQCEGFIRYW